MTRQMTAAALRAAAALLLTGCNGSGEPGEDSTTSAVAQEPNFEGRWQADDPEDAFVVFTEVDDGGGRLSGSDGCNGLMGEFFIDGDTMTVEDSEGEELGTLTRDEDAETTAPGSTGSPSASIGEATDEPTDADD